MATRTPAQVYQDAIGAGFSPDQATIMTAIAQAESSDNDTAVGDVALETSQWGPSFGLFQIRTLKGQTGSGTDRDISYLSASDTDQAKAAYQISDDGRNFAPWTTFTDGAYTQFLPQAQAVAAAGGAPTAATLTGSLLPSFSITQWLQGGLLNAGFLLLAAALAIGGVLVTVGPRRVEHGVQAVVGTAAKVAK